MASKVKFWIKKKYLDWKIKRGDRKVIKIIDQIEKERVKRRKVYADMLADKLEEIERKYNA